MSPDDKRKDEKSKDNKPKEDKPKEVKSKKAKPSKVFKIGHVVLDKKCCVIRNFDEMQKARKILTDLKGAFPQFSLPFMYEDDLPQWPVRVAHSC